MIEQLKLFSEDSDLVSEMLKAATSSFAGAEARWQQRRETGLSDEALMAAIAYEFGTMGGGILNGIHYQVKGGTSPSLTHHLSSDAAMEKRLTGKMLLNKIRSIHSIPLVET